MSEIALPFIPYIFVCGILFAVPAISTVKHAGKLFLLNALVSGPIFYGMILLGGHFNLIKGVIGPVLSLIPEVFAPVLKVVGPVIFWMLIPMLPALVVFLLIRLCAKHYAAEFGLMRLFGTLVCSSTIGLFISFCVVASVVSLYPY